MKNEQIAPKKENRKVRYTRMVIRQSLYELLQTKPLAKITIKELVEVADINRSTFYAHYDTLPALIEEIELENAQKIIDTLAIETYAKEDFKERVFQGFSQLMIHDHDAAFWFLDDQVTGIGRQHIYDYALEHFIPLWVGNKKTDEKTAHFVFAYVYNGTIGIFKKWYQDPSSVSEEELSQIYATLAGNTINLVH